MRPLRHRLGARPVATGLGTLIVAAMVASLVVMPAFGAPPHDECSSTIWNGEYYKVGVDDRHFTTTGVETSLSTEEGTINLTIAKQGNTAQVTWSNDTQYGVFRIYEKYGRLDDQITNESFAPGESDTFEIEKSISHITFCFGENPQVAIDKVTNGGDHSTSNPNYIAAGETVTWTYTVTNEGTVPLSNVTVTDSDSNVSPAYASGDTDGDGELDLGETWVFTDTGVADASTSTWAGGDLDGYGNTGTVTADFGDTQVSDTDDSGYYASDPSISIDCNFLTDGDPVPCENGLNVAEGDDVVWEFTIENTGNVPLSSIVVKEKVDEGNLDDLAPDSTTCDTDLDDPLNPGESDSCTFTEQAAGGDTSEFVVIGTDPLSETTDATSGSVDYNVAPVAVDDSYEVNERASESAANTLTAVADGDPPGVLDNDTDADGDTLSADAGTISTDEGGTVELAADGSFEYEPALLTDAQWDALGAFSYVDSWEYTVTDGNGGSDTGTVEITVNRVICTDETVTASEGDVIGSFTLLSTTNEPCKAYSVAASDSEGLTDDLITLTVPGDGNVSTFRGELTFSPQTLDGNDDFVLSLEYDPDNEGPEPFRSLLICESATFVDGLVVDATLPVDESWCNAGWTSRASGGGEILTVIQVFGEEDPGFSFR